MTISRLLGARGVTICGGGLSGVMEAVTRVAKEEGAILSVFSRIRGWETGIPMY
jgi:predicted Rossmann-fold nucleotide-binding protein